jgi:hypothetical protein
MVILLQELFEIVSPGDFAEMTALLLTGSVRKVVTTLYG